MLLNLLIILFVIIFGFLHKVNKSPSTYNSALNRKIYIYVVAIILILQSALRHLGVGMDTYMYYVNFEDAKDLSWIQALQEFVLYFKEGIGKDPGYPFFMKLFQIFSGSNRLYLFFIAILFFTCLGRFLYYNTKKLDELIIAFVVYLVMFYSFYSITGLRQTIVMSICLFSFEFVKRKKLLPFLLCIASVYTIHKTAVFFVPVYFLYHTQKTRLIYIVALCLFPVIFALKNQIAVFMVQFSGKAYETYKDFEGESGTYTFTFFILLLALVFLFLMKNIVRANQNAQPILNIFALSVIITPLTYVNPSLMRIVMYYSFFLVLLIPFLVQSFTFLSSKISSLAGVVVVAMLILLFIKSNEGHDYHFFWERMFIKSENKYG